MKLKHHTEDTYWYLLEYELASMLDPEKVHDILIVYTSSTLGWFKSYFSFVVNGEVVNQLTVKSL